MRQLERYGHTLWTRCWQHYWRMKPNVVLSLVDLLKHVTLVETDVEWAHTCWVCYTIRRRRIWSKSHQQYNTWKHVQWLYIVCGLPHERFDVDTENNGNSLMAPSMLNANTHEQVFHCARKHLPWQKSYTWIFKRWYLSQTKNCYPMRESVLLTRESFYIDFFMIWL